MSNARPKLKMLLVVAISIPIAGCATTGGGGTEGVCSRWRPITWSKRDTAETVAGVKINNANRKAWCDGRG